MTVLDPRQIGILIFKNGTWGPGGSEKRVVKFLDIAIAVAYGESGWNTSAVNHSSGATGLYQIMPTVHADKINGRDLTDPVVNVDVAARIYDEAEKAGKDPWSPWEAYTSKSPKYKAGLGHGQDVYDYLSLISEQELGAAYADLLGSVIPGGVAISAGSNALETAKDWGNWLQNNLVGIGIFVVALVLLILGVVVILAGSKVGKVASNVIPIKRLAG